MHSFEELFSILEKRTKAGQALELIGQKPQIETDGPREFVRIAKIKRAVDGDWGFATFLLARRRSRAGFFFRGPSEQCGTGRVGGRGALIFALQP
jgi:hypothetical protein